MLVHSYRTEIKVGVNCLKEVRTLQANKWWGSAKACQIVSIKHTLHLGVKVSVWIATFVLQLHLDVALELIIFGENRYNRDLKFYQTCQSNS